MAPDSIADVSVGETVERTDDTWILVKTLSPSEAYSLVQRYAPDAVISSVGGGVRAKDLNPRTTQNDSVCAACWTNGLAVVVDVNYMDGVVTVVQRTCREYSKKIKLFGRLKPIPSGTNLATW